MRNVIVIWFVAVSLGFGSCEKAFMEDDPVNDPVKNFEILWETFDQKYPYFPFKSINWDSIHDVYRPKVYQGMSDQELFDVMANMLFHLKDGHVNIESDFDRSRYWQMFLDAPPNFDWPTVEREYLEDDHLISGPLRNTVLKDSVGYIYYGSFGSEVKPDNIDFVIDRFKNKKGIILDVRNNGGGSNNNAWLLASRFADQERWVMNEQLKAGPGHDEFTGRFRRYVEPQGDRQFTKSVVLLTNRSTFSAANDFTLMMSAFPHVTQIGDTTGGGGGFPIHSELPNGWTYRFSSTITEAPDGTNVEFGIPPDEVVYMNDTNALKGRDPIIEAAMDEILR